MTTETLFESVLRRLDASKGRHREISAGSGVNYSTLSKIVQRYVKNPGVVTVQNIADFFDKDSEGQKPSSKGALNKRGASRREK